LPLFPFSQRLFCLYALGNVDIVPDHTHDATVLVVIPAPPGGEPSNLARRTHDSELYVELFVVADSGITLRFHCGEIVRMHPRPEVLVSFSGPSLHAIEFIEFRRPRAPTTNHIPVPDSNSAATHRQTQAFLAVTQRLCGSFQIGNIRNRCDPARDL